MTNHSLFHVFNLLFIANFIAFSSTISQSSLHPRDLNQFQTIRDSLPESDQKSRQKTDRHEFEYSSPRQILTRFRAKREYQDEQCGGEILLKSSVRLKSPGFDNGRYPSNTHCVWNIILDSKDDESTVDVKLTLKQLRIEKSEPDCTYDYLAISGYGRICGERKNVDLKIGKRDFQITFHSDADNEELGFDLEIKPQRAECKERVDVVGPSASIASPGYPDNYPDSTDCWTLIDASEYQKRLRQRPINLTIQFHTIDIESADGSKENCNYDYVEFFSVNQSTMKPDQLLGRFCESNRVKIFSRLGGIGQPVEPPLPVVKATGPFVIAHFKSDQLLNAAGFIANITIDGNELGPKVDCGWKLNEVSSTVSSPNFPRPYPPNFSCELEIRAPNENLSVALVFDQFRLEPEPNCSSDRLEIWEVVKRNDYNIRNYESLVDSRQAILKQVFCGTYMSKFKFLSDSPKIILKFITDEFAEFTGFRANYSFITKLPDTNSSAIIPSLRVDGKELQREFLVKPQDAQVALGSAHVMICIPPVERSSNIFGPKKATQIVWLKGGKQLTDGEFFFNRTHLLIRRFNVSHIGVYTCQYGDSKVSARLDKRNFEYGESCALIRTKSPPSKYYIEGESEQFECGITVPVNLQSRVAINWTKNSGNVTFDERIYKRNRQLYIDSMRVEDSGYYICSVSIDDRCTMSSVTIIDIRKRLNIESMCGQSMYDRKSNKSIDSSDDSKIVNGKTVIRGAHPWHAMLWNINRKAFCGAVILNEQWLLTAAHCLDENQPRIKPPRLEDVYIRLGKFDQEIEEDVEQRTKIRHYSTHPKYKIINNGQMDFNHDIALIKVADNIIFNDYVRPICLGNYSFIEQNFFIPTHSPVSSVRHAPFVKREKNIFGTIAGWGQLAEDTTEHPRYLRDVKLPIVDQDICVRSTQKKVTENMFCAGFDQEITGDACKGDSGGSFVGRVGDRSYAIGIVSWGEGCGRKGQYGFYTKVNNYIPWIRSIIDQ